MAIKTLSDFKNRIKQGVSGAREASKNIIYSAKSNVKTYKMKNKLANEMMEKEYVSPTMGNKTWDKRRKETRRLIGQGKMKQARENLQNLKKKFKEENPEYTQ